MALQSEKTKLFNQQRLSSEVTGNASLDEGGYTSEVMEAGLGPGHDEMCWCQFHLSLSDDQEIYKALLLESFDLQMSLKRNLS